MNEEAHAHAENTGQRRLLRPILSVHAEQAATIKEEAKRLGSTTAFVRELIDDYRTMFGLPGIQVEVLEADMKNLKLPTHREYIRHLLALRYQTLLEQRAGGSKTSKR